MHPDAVLKELRALANRVFDHGGRNPDDALVLVEQIHALDRWLSRGGSLPADWER